MKNYMYEYGYGSAMGGFSIFSFLIALVVLADLILVGVFLWKHIQKK